jgi:hypothetical protein
MANILGVGSGVPCVFEYDFAGGSPQSPRDSRRIGCQIGGENSRETGVHVHVTT